MQRDNPVKQSSKTSIGGTKGMFQTTQWSVILAARINDENQRKAVINELMARYWKPVYCYLRRKGYSNAAAKDLTQGFFCDIVLGRELIQHADKTKGRFRTLLLTALDRYAVSMRRKEGRQKRKPRAGIKQLDMDDPSVLTALHLEMNPDEAFYYTWATDFLDKVLVELKEEYCSTGRNSHWQVFWSKVVVPIIENVEAPSYTEICKQLNIEDESKASNMSGTVKRRFRTILKRRLREHVQSDSEIDDELNEVFEILSNCRAG